MIFSCNVPAFFFAISVFSSAIREEEEEEEKNLDRDIWFVWICFHVCTGTCACVLSTVCFSLLTVAAEGDKPNEQGPSFPEAGRTQSLYRRLLQRPAQTVHPGRWKDLWGLWEQATSEWPGIHLLCACCSGDVRECKSTPWYSSISFLPVRKPPC